MLEQTPPQAHHTEAHRHLLDAVKAAGPVALDFFNNGVESWEKNPGDPVSEADHAIDAQLKAHLTAACPDYGWLSEETEDNPERLQQSRVWIVDPIDGTRAFLRGQPEFTICAALVEHGRPVAAAVYNPASDELFDAVSGGGARLNGTPIQASEHASFKGAKLLAGERMFERAGWKDAPRDIHFRAINSIAYRMALVAAGRFDGCISLNGKSDWDIAAAELLAIEAGALVTTSKGGEFTYNNPDPRHHSVIIAGPAMHRVIMDFLDDVPRPAHAKW